MQTMKLADGRTVVEARNIEAGVTFQILDGRIFTATHNAEEFAVMRTGTNEVNWHGAQIRTTRENSVFSGGYYALEVPANQLVEVFSS